jgi:signal transduction histidine kinase
MERHRMIILVSILLAFAAIAAWQWDEYGHECELAHTTVANSSDSIMNALVGGVQSHRRLGPFFAEQVQGALDGLVLSKDVLAVALVSEDGRSVLSAGQRELLNLTPPFVTGPYWDENGFRLTKLFALPSESAGPLGGRGGGFGGGQGWRRRQMEEQAEERDDANAFIPGKQVAAILLVSRDHADMACRHAAWTRGFIVIAGWVVVLCVALAWRATMRLTEARGRARTLEAETRHFRDLSQAAAGLAHETRNPLGLIRGWTQRLADTSVESSETRQRAQTIIEECDRLTARINQFLAFARPAEPKTERFDPAELIKELAILLEPDLEAKHLVFHSMAVGNTMEADREMFREALFNLLQNAIHASPENGILETSMVRKTNHRLRIEVADCGDGVPENVVGKLFTPYFTTRSNGTGLGLAIVHRIAVAHGWEVGYSPRPGGGAIFWLDGIHG